MLQTEPSDGRREQRQYSRQFQYNYNGDGLRTRKTVGATTTDFTWGQTGLGTVLQIADGTVNDAYLWGAGLLGRIDGSGVETYAHGDGLGSIRAISDSSGVEVGTTAYDAFGATRATTGIRYAFGFTGEQADAETGRFVSQDPIGLAGGDINLYGFVGNTPTSEVDPSGLCEENICGSLSDGVAVPDGINVESNADKTATHALLHPTLITDPVGEMMSHAHASAATRIRE